jgi:MFS family permease
MSRRGRAPSIILILLCLMYFLTYIDRVNLATSATTLQKEFGFSNTDMGQLLAAFAWPYAVFQVIGGWVGDRFGPRKTLLLCGAIWALSTAATGLAGGFTSLFACRVALGFGEGATFPTATRAMQGWVAPDKRGFAQGITHSFARLGNAVTPPLVAQLMIWYSWRHAFVILGGVSLIWAVVWWFYFRDDPRDHPSITKEDLAVLPERAKRSARRMPLGRLAWRILPVTFTYFCYGWSLWLFLTWLPSYFAKTGSLDVKKSAFYSSAVFFAGVVGDALGGVISDHLLRKTGRVTFSRLVVIVPAMLCAAGCLTVVWLTTRPTAGYKLDLTLVTLCLAGGFFFLEIVIGPIWAVPMDIAPQYSGMASGLMNTGSAVAAIVSPIAFGAIVDATGDWNLPFLGSIGLLLAGSVLAFTMRPHKKFVEPAELPRALDGITIAVNLARAEGKP